MSWATGCMRCLAIVGPTLGANFCHGFVLYSFHFSQKPSSSIGPTELKTLMQLMLLCMAIYSVLWL